MAAGCGFHAGGWGRVTRGGKRDFSVDMKWGIAVYVSGRTFAGGEEGKEDERLYDLESPISSRPRCGNGIGVTRTARKKRFIAKDTPTICPRRRNAHKFRIFRLLPMVCQGGHQEYR
jgi:hypothetical protein